MNPRRPVALDSYVEDTTPKIQPHYVLFALVSAGVHLVLLFTAYPQLQFFKLPTPQTETNPVFHITLNREPVTPQQPDSDIDERPVSTSSVSDTSAPASTPEKVAEIDAQISESALVEAEANELPDIAEAAETPQTEQAWESARNLDLDDPEYNGNVFDPRVREKILVSRARKNLAQPEPEIQTYQQNDGSMLIVDGDTCYQGRELDEFSGTVWSIGYRCPWVKSQSQIMMDNVNAAMKARFGRQ